jgi:hypothetical protein
MPGGYFLVQQMSIDGEDATGAEYIGYDYRQDALRSMFFSNEGPGPFCAFALEYVWEIDGDASRSGTARRIRRRASPASSTAQQASSTGGGSGPVVATARPHDASLLTRPGTSSDDVRARRRSR